MVTALLTDLLLVMMQLSSKLDETLSTSFQHRYGNNSQTTEVLDFIQVQASICHTLSVHVLSNSFRPSHTDP